MSSSFLYSADINIVSFHGFYIFVSFLTCLANISWSQFGSGVVFIICISSYNCLSCPIPNLLGQTPDCCHTSLGLLLCLPVYLTRFQKSLSQSLCVLIFHFIHMFEASFYCLMLFQMSADCMVAVRIRCVYWVFLPQIFFPFIHIASNAQNPFQVMLSSGMAQGLFHPLLGTSDNVLC